MASLSHSSRYLVHEKTINVQLAMSGYMGFVGLISWQANSKVISNKYYFQIELNKYDIYLRPP